MVEKNHRVGRHGDGEFEEFVQAHGLGLPHLLRGHLHHEAHRHIRVVLLVIPAIAKTLRLVVEFNHPIG